MHIYLRHGNDDKVSTYKHDKSLNSASQTEIDIVKKTRWLVKTYGFPSIIYCSPFKRARATLDIMIKYLSKMGDVKVRIDNYLSRLFVKNEYLNPSVRKTTMYYNPPIKENKKDFRRRVDKAEARASAEAGVTWSITHYLVMRRLSRKYDIALPKHMPFLYHVIIEGK